MDGSQGLVAFVKSVEAGSFSAAARLIGTTPSAVSKSIARLERRVSTRLFRRSTRELVLTDEGASFYDAVAPLLRGLDDAAEALRSGPAATGTLKVTMPTVLAHSLFDDVVDVFMIRHPDLVVQLSITDRHVDLIREGYDMAVRLGQIADTGLTARSLGTIPLLLVGSPEYLDRRGRPLELGDLEAHAHVRYLFDGRPYPLQFAEGTSRNPPGVLDTDNGALLRRAALKGVGLSQLLKPLVAMDLLEGRLEQVLPNIPGRQVPIHVVHAFARHPPLRVKIFTEFVAERLKA